MPKRRFSHSFVFELCRDETCEEIEVEYRIIYHGHPGSGLSFISPGDPPEAPEFDINEHVVFDGQLIELTADELYAVEQALLETEWE